MTNAVVPERRYHAVAYVSRSAERRDEPDVVTYGELIPEPPGGCSRAWTWGNDTIEATFKGDTLRPKGHLLDDRYNPTTRKPADYGCRPSDDQVTVLARPDGTCRVDWDREDGKTIRGTATPTRAFEIKRFGITLRVEAREIVPDDAGAGAGSQNTLESSALDGVKSDLAERRARTEMREDLRSELEGIDDELRLSMSTAEESKSRLVGPAARRFFRHRMAELNGWREQVRTKAADLLARPKISREDLASFRDFSAHARLRIEELGTFLLNVALEGFECEGTVTITARQKANEITRWSVRFKNESEQPWIGTMCFAGRSKNDGFGFESMAVPKKGAEAEQQVFADQNYGLTPAAGEMLRVGVRGHSWLEVPLPAHGSVTYSVRDFQVESNDGSTIYFEQDHVLKKRDEKRGTGRVTFYQGGRRQ